MDKIMQLEDYTTGTASIANGSTTLTGTGTAWKTAGVKAGDTFYKSGYAILIKSVDDEDQITTVDPWLGATLSDAAYVIRFQPDNSRMQGTTRQLLDELRQGIWLTPDATGKTADKADYDDRPKGFRFLDVSVDPFKVYVKESDDDADWSSGASWVGPAGAGGSPGSAAVVGTSETSLAIATGSKTFAIEQTNRGWGLGARLRASSDANAANFMEGVVTAYADDSLTLSVDRKGGSGTKADWTINLIGQPGEDGEDGRSIEWQGDWSTATEYAVDDAVKEGGSSYICVTAHTAGTFATDLSAGKWNLMAQKGADGTGTGDVVGPSSATDGNVAVFDGADGKKIKDGGALFSGSYNDLSDLPIFGNAAGKDVGTGAGTVAAGDDSRITGAAQKADLASTDAGKGAALVGIEAIAALPGVTDAQGALEALALSVGGITQGATVTLSANPTSITDVPAGVKKIELYVRDLKSSAVVTQGIQLGKSSGLVTSGYNNSWSNGGPGIYKTDQFSLWSNNGDTLCAMVTLYNLGGNVWLCAVNSATNTGWAGNGVGRLSLGDALTSVAIIASSGTFVSGTVTPVYYF